MYICVYCVTSQAAVRVLSHAPASPNQRLTIARPTLELRFEGSAGLLPSRSPCATPRRAPHAQRSRHGGLVSSRRRGWQDARAEAWMVCGAVGPLSLLGKRIPFHERRVTDRDVLGIHHDTAHSLSLPTPPTQGRPQRPEEEKRTRCRPSLVEFRSAICNSSSQQPCSSWTGSTVLSPI